MEERLIKIFEDANKSFIRSDIDLLLSKVSERTLCGALMIHIYNFIKNSEFIDYKVDVEYNRNKNGKVKTSLKTIRGPKDIVVKINCDLIVHSRGNIIEQDNLIAIEMKKSGRKQDEKDNDRFRLIALTKDSYDEIWSFDGKTLPEHVCRYALGIYYEIDYRSRRILLEYYCKGHKFLDKELEY
ncbi:hypothetical protein Back11_17820 [Paenibacillus baekrokdamisoli]|uniref:Uncharacterized protein n=1 Tax=Paenibacillus baekrokdamisoli TaxID=1712516 RepID=A0A3G9INI6_9BACL|nr:hypothetical protein [Paenibacillus baekrokdamisoli]MBB3073477.1 hypothetical protein [Paenibacillus baekrokdamisoli]BBH20437.1 hypothetical protein Back11_17820 [Paenibacillus baekrokdamisoli]